VIIAVFENLYIAGNVATQLRCGGVVVYVIIALLHIVHRLCHWKHFQNQSIFGEDGDKSLVACLSW